MFRRCEAGALQLEFGRLKLPSRLPEFIHSFTRDWGHSFPFLSLLNPRKNFVFNISLWNTNLARYKGLHSSIPKNQSHEDWPLSPDRLQGNEQDQSWLGISSAHSATRPVPWKNTGHGARFLPSGLSSHTCCVPVGVSLYLSWWMMVHTCLYVNMTLLWTEPPHPADCFAFTIAFNLHNHSVGIWTRASLTPDAMLSNSDGFSTASRLVYHLHDFCYSYVPSLLLFSNLNTLILRGKYISLP